MGGLMDSPISVEERLIVEAALSSSSGDGVEWHALRTRQAGARRFIEVHDIRAIVFPARTAAHDCGTASDWIVFCLYQIFMFSIWPLMLVLLTSVPAYW